MTLHAGPNRSVKALATAPLNHAAAVLRPTTHATSGAFSLCWWSARAKHGTWSSKGSRDQYARRWFEAHEAKYDIGTTSSDPDGRTGQMEMTAAWSCASPSCYNVGSKLSMPRRVWGAAWNVFWYNRAKYGWGCAVYQGTWLSQISCNRRRQEGFCRCWPSARQSFRR